VASRGQGEEALQKALAVAVRNHSKFLGNDVEVDLLGRS
jgi:hypothetical protein